MTLDVKQGDLFDATTEAVVLPVSFDSIDPANLAVDDLAEEDAGRLAGNTARQFHRRWPNAWRHVLDHVEGTARTDPGSLHPGRTLEVAVPDGACPFRVVFLASILPHTGEAIGDDVASFVSACTETIVRRAWSLDRLERKTVATGLMAGGWRLTTAVAFEAILDGYIRGIRALAVRDPEVARKMAFSIFVLDPRKHALVSERIRLRIGR